MKNLLIIILIAASCSVFGQDWNFTKSVDDFTDEVTLFAGGFGEGKFPYSNPAMAISGDEDGLFIGIANGGVFSNEGLTFKLRVDKGFVYTTEQIYLRAYNNKLYFTDYSRGGEREKSLGDLVSELKTGGVVKLYVYDDYGHYSMSFTLGNSDQAINKLLKEINQ
jgi:hypothetical protein